MLTILGGLLAAVGFIAAIIYSIRILIAAFKTSILWGLGSLIVPFVGLVYVIMHWGAVGKLFLYSLAGTIVGYLGVFLMAAGKQ
jgi:hypothetical protein